MYHHRLQQLGEEMKCKNCKRDLPENALYCCWCGAEQLKNKGDYHVPEPKKRDGYYSGRITINGKKVTIKGETRREYYANVQQAKKEAAPQTELPTLEKAIQDYIDINTNVLSPSTIRGYTFIKKTRFTNYQKQKIDTINYQKMINECAKEYSPKTTKNSWGLVSAACKNAGYTPPAINLPAVPIATTDYLDHQQVKIFLQAIKGDDAEPAALLALHSLRLSELMHLQAKDIQNGIISVHGATVRDKTGKWVDKNTNKNRTSTRDIPIILPRLEELIPKNGKVVTIGAETIRQRLKRICEANKLPVVSVHDLRRTFATLAAYLKWQEETICAVGGWKPGSPIVHDVYVKVSNKAIQEDVKKMADYLKNPPKNTPKKQKVDT